MFFNRNFWDVKLLKVMSINSASVIVRLISGFILSKLIATQIGPNGMGLIGNLRSLLNGLQSLGSLGFNNGLVNYSSKNKNDHLELSKLFSTVFFSSLIITGVISLILFFLSGYISEVIFNSSKYELIIKILSFSLPFLIGNYLCVAVLNGFSEYKRYTVVNIISSIIGLVIGIIMVLKLNLYGMLCSIVIVPIFFFIVSLYFLLSNFPIIKYLNFKFFNFKYLSNLSEYSAMTLLSILIVPPTLIAIRNHITTVDNLINMGLWESMNRISNYYLMFISTLLSLYLYPKLSNTNSNKESKKIILLSYKTLGPIVLIGLISLYYLRHFVIRFLFSKEFIEMEVLFFWQLLGDLFKIISSVLAYQFMAKKMTKIYILTEILSVTIWYLSSVFLINNYGFVGASMGYLVCQFCYFLMLLFCFRKVLFTG